MEHIRPPPPPPSSSGKHSRDMGASSNQQTGAKAGEWEHVETDSSSSPPCQRSLHAGAVWEDFFLVFGGYDGHHRVNDLHAFNFKTNTWSELNNFNAPSPRDRHVATVFDNSLYIFGGFDGLARVNDLHAFDLVRGEWQSVPVTAGMPPTPRHSHAAVVYQNSMFVFGGKCNVCSTFVLVDD